MTGLDAHELLELVATARRATGDDARPEAVARSHRRDKLTARERIAALVDEGSFREFGQLARLPDGEYDGLPGIDATAATAYGDGVSPAPPASTVARSCSACRTTARSAAAAARSAGRSRNGRP